jgi:hypothetical protein
MSEQVPDKQQDKEPWADIRARLEDLGRQPGGGRWAVIKDRLAIVAVVLVLLLFLFLMIDGSIMNFRCSFVENITFVCNRWAGGEAP